MRKPLKNAVAIAAVTVIMAALSLIIGGSRYITVRERDTGKMIACYPAKDGDRFSVSFLHSVNRTPVEDIYEIEDGHIFVEECLYYGFGAGVQSELNPGEVLTKTKDGGMLISGIHQNRDNVGYIVGTVYDHVLHVNGEEISLRELCGRNAAVRIHYERLYGRGNGNDRYRKNRY